MTVAIRQVTEKTLSEFYNLFSKTVKSEFPEYTKNQVNFFLSKPWSRESYREQLKKKARMILIAKINKKVVGVLDAGYPFLGVSFCSWLVVSPKHQRMGIGKKLLKKWEQLVKKEGAHFIYLYAEKRNIPYYEKIGFKQAGFMEKAWFGHNHYIFVKQIQEPKEENYLK